MDSEEEKKAKRAAKIKAGIALAKKLYALGSYYGPRIAQIAIFDHRGSDAKTYFDSFEAHLLKTQPDFPALQKRQVLHFRSGPNLLTAYLYEADAPRALLIVAHGFTSLADGSGAILQDYFLHQGYDVLAVDLTASGRSEGDSIGGMHQSAYDLQACLEWVHQDRKLYHFPILLLGHSWGAFGCCAVLNFDQSPKAVVAMSGYVSPDALMLAEAKSKAGPFAELTKPDLDAALKERSGAKGFLSAVQGINKAKKTHVLLIQGGCDETVPVQDCSIFDQDANLKNRHVQKLFYPKKHHEDIWYAQDSCDYIASFRKAESDLLRQYKKLANVPPSTLQACYNLIDKEKSSQLDYPLMSSIDAFFRKSL
jgi:dienelactone hydrolase